jgi:hypothetical protein
VVLCPATVWAVYELTRLRRGDSIIADHRGLGNTSHVGHGGLVGLFQIRNRGGEKPGRFSASHGTVINSQ